MTLEIAFPQSSSADATRLAKQLRADLVEQGAPADGVALKRSNSEDMSWADIVYVGNLAIETFIATHGVYQLANIIHEFSMRNQSVLLLKTELGTVLQVKRDSAVAAITDLLKQLQELAGDQSRK
jgi:hypothetical protein